MQRFVCARVWAAALEFAALTAARSQEVRGARWNEIDMAKAMWVVPAERGSFFPLGLVGDLLQELLRTRAFRVRKEVLGGGFFDLFSTIHEDNAVGDLTRKTYFMRDA